VKEQVGVYLDESVISLSLFTPDLDLFDLTASRAAYYKERCSIGQRRRHHPLHHQPAQDRQV
jgi:hypothetical protein